MSETRDIEPVASPADNPGRVTPARPAGRNVIAVIGIDRYQHGSWRPLANAVADARGAAALFQELGFELVAALYGDDATSEAIEGLVSDDLTKLGPEDSLVLFYAGHGSTRLHQVGDQEIKTGYLIPVDASDLTASWIELDGWLRAIALLPAKHILVILDACHSGIALGAVMKWRDGGPAQPLPMSTLRARPSRRVITSALDNEQALDSGPYPGHSLFTGCLIELLTHGDGPPGSQAITGSELGVLLQKRVESYPKARQTPDFGTFDHDKRGEMIIPFLHAPPDPPPRKGGKQSPGKNTGDQAAIDRDRERERQRRRRRRIIAAAAASTTLALVLVLVLRARKQRAADTAPPAITASPSADAARAAPHAPPTGAPPAAERSQSLASQGGCPAGMVRVPAGTFLMGSPDGTGDDNEHPQHEVTLSEYCIDRTEVTVQEYRRCVEAGVCSPTLPPEAAITSGLECNRVNQPDHPINCVDWNQAVAFCAWKKQRLPTEAEWEYAARGSTGRRYPWGDQPPTARRLNACSSECVKMAAQLPVKQTRDGLDNEDDGWPMTAPVGSFPHDASPFGVLDMAGNVAEWTANSFRDYTSAAVTNPTASVASYTRTIRGGSCLVGRARDVSAARRTWRYAFRAFIDIGFRCVLRH